MCRESAAGWPKEHFDHDTRCIVRKDGLATRYLGMPKAIFREIEEAGFQIKARQVIPARGRKDQDELRVVTTREETLDPGHINER